MSFFECFLLRLVEKSKKALEVQHLAKENAFLQEKLNFQEQDLYKANKFSPKDVICIASLNYIFPL